MERWAIRKRLRQLYRVLVNSRAALDNASSIVTNKWLQDLLFTLACRRSIMLNLLDKELGSMAVRVPPATDASHRLDPYVVNRPLSDELFRACQNDEVFMLRELKELVSQSGLAQHTRFIIMELIGETEENMKDLRFLRVNLGSRG